MVARNATNANSIIAQGTLTIGAATTQLTATPTPCSCVWFGAGSAGGNSATVYIGGDDTSNTAGGRPLAAADVSGFMLPTADASSLYVTGTEGDTVEFQIYG
jgi:hypothetical protein